MEHYNRAPAAPIGKSQLKQINLTDQAIEQVIAFMQSLSSPLVVPPDLLAMPLR